jgi:DNA-binding GntR family transcriptional regulator
MSTAQYKKIYNKLRTDILKGKFSVGSKMSSERDICSRFKCSRITVRHAFRLLEENGFIQRAHGSGTYVKSTKPSKIAISEYGFANSIKQNAPDMKRKLICFDQLYPPGHVRDALALDGSKCFYAQRLDILNNENIAYDNVYILADYGSSLSPEILIRIDFLEKWIEAGKIKFSYNTESIEAVKADKTNSMILKVKRGVPLLRTYEVFFNKSNKPIVVFESFYRGDRIKLISNIKK